METASEDLAVAIREAKALSHDLSEARWRAEEAEKLLAEVKPTLTAATRAVEKGLGLQEEVRNTYGVWEGHCLSLSLSLGFGGLPKRYTHP